jgi:hypothetical protein
MPAGVRLRVSHKSGNRALPKSTPLIDAIGSVVAVASVVIGGYAALFLTAAALGRRWDVAAHCALFFVFIVVANALVDAARWWSRHRG